MTGPDRQEPNGASGYGLAAAATLLALATALVAQPWVGLENVDLILLVAVIAVAAREGPGPAAAACVASVAAYNFFFLPPLYTFVIADPKHVTALVLFLVASLITSNLAGLLRLRSLQARRRAETTEALYVFSSRLARLTQRGEVVQAAVETAGTLLDGASCVLLPDADGALRLEPPSVSSRALEPFELWALRSAWADPGPQGAGLMRIEDTWFAPMRSAAGFLGALGIAPRTRPAALAPDEERKLQALADQSGLALERIRATGERDAAQLAAESERLRSALLNSLSHDLKTPLASILGAATSLRDFDALYDPEQREELVGAIAEETERMARFVTNLLDMARLESGSVAPRSQPTDVGEIVGAALRRTASLTRDHVVDVTIEQGLPLLLLDPVLLEQCLANLADNAAKFSPPGSRISVEVRTAEQGRVEIAVRDQGPGVAPEDRDRVFDLFHQIRGEDRGPAGSGVGLAICRGFVNAMGGSIRAEDNSDGPGAAFVIAFPMALALGTTEIEAETREGTG
jgi:two-component system sensor histidine kinase KdpD